MGVWYATLEQLARATDIRATARRRPQLIRALESGAIAVRNLCHRHFYPLTATRFFDWPNQSYSRPWRLWLDQWELISATTVTAGGVVIPSTDYFLWPYHGPPFRRLEIDLGSTASFQTGATHQQAISILGVFGHRNEEAPAGQLNGTIDASTTTVDVTTSVGVGVGTLLRCEDERLLVTGRSMVDTLQDLGGAGLTAQRDDVTVTVTDGAEFDEDEIIQIGSEKLLVVEITGDQLTVERAEDGTVLATHTAGTSIFAPRSLTVERGAVGTTAAAHTDGTALARWVPPGLATDLNLAEAIVRLQQELATYARTVGHGEHQREASGRGLAELRADCRAALGRRMRKRAV